jgi:TM2 domain-containing membrane protein YozV
MSAAGRTPRQRGLAALLAFVGGVVGAQYFYMGRYAAGVACVVMCWTGYSLALGFVDGMRLLTLTDSEFARECVS